MGSTVSIMPSLVIFSLDCDFILFSYNWETTLKSLCTEQLFGKIFTYIQENSIFVV